MQGDDDPEHHPPEFVAPPQVQDQAAGLDAAPADAPQHPCPICGRPFDRNQEMTRHLCTFLPHSIYCAFPQCSYRCNRHDALASHWEKKHGHANGGRAPQQQQHYQIYDSNQLVTRVINGHMTMDDAIAGALSMVEMRAQQLGKEGAWAGDLWGRCRMRPHVFEQ